MKIKFKPLIADVTKPKYAQKGDSGMDICLYAPLDTVFCNEKQKEVVGVRIPAFGRALLSTKISVGIPEGWEIQVRPRSGLALKKGLTVLNTPGTVDSGYTGEIKVIIFNTTDKSIVVEHGERIAQIVLAPVGFIEWEDVGELDSTDRGDGGFGSTGVSGAPIPVENGFIEKFVWDKFLKNKQTAKTSGKGAYFICCQVFSITELDILFEILRPHCFQVEFDTISQGGVVVTKPNSEFWIQSNGRLLFVELQLNAVNDGRK